MQRTKKLRPTLPIPGNRFQTEVLKQVWDRWGGNIREVGGYEFGMAMHSQRPVVDCAKSRGTGLLKISVP